MDKPTWKPHDGYSGTELHDDYSEAWKYIEHLEVERDRAWDRARTAAQTLIAKIGAPGPEWVEETAARAAERIQVLEAELFKESARGDFLNARNGRLEHEIGMVKPGSAANAFMEEEYERMKSQVSGLLETIEQLCEAVENVSAHCYCETCKCYWPGGRPEIHLPDCAEKPEEA